MLPSLLKHGAYYIMLHTNLQNQINLVKLELDDSITEKEFFTLREKLNELTIKFDALTRKVEALLWHIH
jgi:hypothetical protein